MESSNADLRQKIDALQSELSSLETMTKEGVSQVEARMNKEKQALEEEAQRRIGLLMLKVQEKEESEKDYLTKISKMEEERDALKEEIRAQILSCEELSHKTESLKMEMESKMSRLEEDLHAETSKNSGFVQREEERIREGEKLQGEMDRLKKERDTVTLNLQKLQDEYQTKTEALTKQLHDLSSKCEEYNDLNIHLDNSSTVLRDQLASLEDQLKQKQTRLASYHKALCSQLNPEREINENSDIEEVLKSLCSEKNGLKDENERLLRTCEENVRALNDLKIEMKKKDEKINSLTKELTDAKEKARESLSQYPVEKTITAASITEKENEDLEIESAIDRCKEELFAEYQMKLAELKSSYEEEKKTWRTQTEEQVRSKETEMTAKINDLTQQWNADRKELERLSQVAAEAFRSGTSSVDLLKAQVTAQKRELDELRRNHRKEMGELQALLEVKRRRGRGGHGEVKGGGALEESAEFEYLKNILYQYMMGKETQTLSKVLCAVVKFSKDQQRQIIEYEDKKQNLLREAELVRKSVMKQSTKRQS